MTAIAELQVRSTDKGKSYYESITRQCKGTSQYQKTQFSFENLEGYWESSDPLTIGQWYDLELATRPKTGQNSKPGSLYMDIVRASPAEDAVSGQDLQDQAEWWEDMGDPRAQEPAERPIPAEQPKDPIQTRIEKGMAFNAAVSFMVGTDYPHDYTSDSLSSIPHQLQELWHRIYWEVIEPGILPAHYCFDHKLPRRGTKSGTYVHEVGDRWCSEDGMYDAQGSLRSP